MSTRASGRRPSARSPRSSTTPSRRPRRGAGPRRQLLPPAGRERRGAGADRLRPQGQPDQSRRRSSPAPTSCSRTSSTTQAAAILRTAIELTAKDGKAKPPAVFYLMLAAVENETPPAADALPRALKVLDDGPEGPSRRPRSWSRPGTSPWSPRAAPPRRWRSSRPRPRRTPRGRSAACWSRSYREQKQYDRAEQLLAELHKEFPDESNLAAALVQIVSLQAAEAASRGPGRPAAAAQGPGRVHDPRVSAPGIPTTSAFLQAECDMAARRGDFTQAIALTREIDKVAKTSTLGPLLRVRLFTMLGRPDEVAHAYGEAIERERGARQLELPHPAGPGPPEDGGCRRGDPPGRAGAGRREEAARRDDPPGPRPGRVGGDAQREGGPAPGRARPAPRAHQGQPDLATPIRPWPTST